MRFGPYGNGFRPSHEADRPLSKPTYDVVAIGNAIVDILAQTDDAFIAAEGMAKGSMQLMFSPEDADALYAKMGPGMEASGGSAANTVAAIAAMGGRCGFIGQVADDQLGDVFGHDIRAAGVDFATATRAGEPTTARCLIFVTPDGQRTMNTFLGASQFLPEAALDRDLIADAAILYLEGYLWDPEEPRAAMRAAIEVARKAGRKVAFTLSDTFCISRHGDDFRKLIADGLIDILFANDAELVALAQTDDFEAGAGAGRGVRTDAGRDPRCGRCVCGAGRHPRRCTRRADRASRRYDRRGRPVRRGVPARPGARARPDPVAAAGRDLRRRDHRPCRRAADRRHEGAGGGEARGLTRVKKPARG